MALAIIGLGIAGEHIGHANIRIIQADLIDTIDATLLRCWNLINANMCAWT